MTEGTPPDPLPPSGDANGASAPAIGVPSSQTETQWCAKCEADVIPRGKGQCPRCGRVLLQSFLGRRHPVNVLRRDQILKMLVAEYQPRTMLLRAACEQLAGIQERLDVIKPGSPEHQRLVQLSQQLGDRLEASREWGVPIPEAFASMTDDAMIARATTLLRNLLDGRDRRQSPSNVDSLNRPPSAEEPGSPAEGRASHADEQAGPRLNTPVDATEEPESANPRPEPRCQYCHQPLTRCAEIKETRLDAWEVLHHDDPDVLKNQDQEATKIMLHQLGMQRRGNW